MKRDATISPCGRYRYTLSRIWGPRVPGVCWIMLNPSTANGEVDDPTIRRCIGFTKRLGYDGLLVVNVFAYRATDPAELLKVGTEAAVGPDNGLWVKRACLQSDLLIAAWGAAPGPFREGCEYVGHRIREEFFGLKCLGVTKDGSPRHPLYLRADAPLIDWPVPAEVTRG